MEQLNLFSVSISRDLLNDEQLDFSTGVQGAPVPPSAPPSCAVYVGSVPLAADGSCFNVGGGAGGGAGAQCWRLWHLVNE